MRSKFVPGGGGGGGGVVGRIKNLNNNREWTQPIFGVGGGGQAIAPATFFKSGMPQERICRRKLVNPTDSFFKLWVAQVRMRALNVFHVVFTIQ